MTVQSRKILASRQTYRMTLAASIVGGRGEVASRRIDSCPRCELIRKMAFVQHLQLKLLLQIGAATILIGRERRLQLHPR